jgi:hypothetical protein
MRRPFINLESNCGWIGPFFWVNSYTMPTPDWITRSYVRRWGAIRFGEPEPGMRFWDEEHVEVPS